MGIDPVTRKPKSQALDSGQLKDAANLSHMAQWEGARLEAEARLVRESKLQVTNPFQTHLQRHHLLLNKAPPPPPPPPPPLPPPPLCLDVLTAWKGTWLKSPKDKAVSGGLESPTSTLNFAENPFPIINTGSFSNNSLAVIDQLVNKSNNLPEIKERIESAAVEFHDMVAYSNDDVYVAETLKNANILIPNFMEGFTDLFHENSKYKENKTYWNSTLNVVNCSPSFFSCE
ncbi:hypothetical protein ACSBR2_006446 [Camellia fascicularis]